MKRHSSQKLSSGEMEMMSLLWEHGPLTISEAHEKLGRPLGYTTVQTRLNRLTEKGLLIRSERRPAKYAAAVSRDDISANHLELLLDRVTGVNIVPLVAHLVGDRSLTRDQLVELKKIIRAAEQRLGKENSES